MRTPALLVCLLLLAPLLAGCLSPLFGDPEPRVGGQLTDHDFAVPEDLSGPVPASAVQWPDFREAAGGEAPVLRILDHGAFDAFADAASRFENLTGAKVRQFSAEDTGSALNQAIEDRGDPQHDIIYGLDNALLGRAIDEGLLEDYRPQLAARVPAELVFFADLDPHNQSWPATPVDQGYIAVNIDAGHPDLNGTEVEDLHELSRNAQHFVTQDPNTSTPGLGFFLITVGRFGETGASDWKQYWTRLFTGPDGQAGTGDEVLITSDWGTAYATHFTGGYGVFTEGHIGDRPIVTSYTESPAYEAYFGAEEIPEVLLDDRGSAFHQIQTMAVLNGTPNRAVAQAWIEFTLTTDFQELAAPQNAVYPIDPDVSTDEVYGDLDPEPGEFRTVTVPWHESRAKLERWLREWTDLCEQHECR